MYIYVYLSLSLSIYIYVYIYIYIRRPLRLSRPPPCESCAHPSLWHSVEPKRGGG